MKIRYSKWIVNMIAVVLLLMPLNSFAAAINLFDGLTINDSKEKGSGNATKYTATVTSSFFGSATNTITLTNTSQVKSTIGFSYNVSGQSAFKIAGQTVSSTDGIYSAVLSGSEELKIELSVKSTSIGSKTATLILENVTYTPVPESSNITIEFDDSLCTVTADGAAVASGSIMTVDKSAVVEFDAASLDGAQFIAWVNESSKIISRSSKYTLESAGDKKIVPLFSKNTPYFEVDDAYMCADLNEATSKGKKIVLICDGILPAGDYVIPQGKTLLIPFDAAHTLYTTKPDPVEGDYVKPAPYRTLTMANGAKVTVNGAISISAKQSCKIGYNGTPVIAYGLINMENGSEITVNSGGNLYVWGYIAGSGKVIAKSGATVYEDFQVRDWRGGDATTKLIDNSQRVFPMSQYYVQNVQVPMTLEAGAIENGYMSVAVTLIGPQGSSIPFIGPNGMFRINSGSVTKDYDEKTDRLIIDVNGNMSMSTLSISMKLSVIGTKTVNSQNYTLPINGNITLNVNSNSEINISQEMALLPGGVINVYSGAECTVSPGSKIFIYDGDEWGKYHFPHKNKVSPAAYVHNRKYTRSDSDAVDAEIYIEGIVDSAAGNVYVTESGANIHGAEGGLVTLKSDTDTAVTHYIKSDGDSNVSFHEIPITTAKMKNADGTYVDPELINCSTEYRYSNGEWIPAHPYGSWVKDDDNTHSKTCECGDVVTEEHNWDEGTITAQPSHTEFGVRTYTCSVCSATKTEQIEKIADHTYGSWTKDDDNTHSKTCECGDVVTEEHNWDEGTITTQPSHTEFGVKTYTCSVCSATKTEQIEKIADHTYGSWTKDDDNTHSRTCECGDVEVVPHTFAGLYCSECGCEKRVTKSEYRIENEKLIVNTSLIWDVPDNTQIIIATYDSLGKLLDISHRSRYLLEEITLPATDVEKIKVFAWEGFDKLIPISFVEEIEI